MTDAPAKLNPEKVARCPLVSTSALWLMFSISLSIVTGMHSYRVGFSEGASKGFACVKEIIDSPTHDAAGSACKEYDRAR